MKTYRYKIATYPSGRKRCFIWREQNVKTNKVIGHWAAIGLDSPEYMTSKGYKVEIEYEFKKPGDKFK
jgi:hypothetical protein